MPSVVMRRRQAYYACRCAWTVISAVSLWFSCSSVCVPLCTLHAGRHSCSSSGVDAARLQLIGNVHDHVLDHALALLQVGQDPEAASDSLGVRLSRTRTDAFDEAHADTRALLDTDTDDSDREGNRETEERDPQRQRTADTATPSTPLCRSESGTRPGTRRLARLMLQLLVQGRPWYPTCARGPSGAWIIGFGYFFFISRYLFILRANIWVPYPASIR